jgi:hypothetical protein
VVSLPAEITDHELTVFLGTDEIRAAMMSAANG